MHGKQNVKICITSLKNPPERKRSVGKAKKRRLDNSEHDLKKMSIGDGKKIARL
jgi:hypothetical protein